MPGHWAWVVQPALCVNVIVVTGHSNSVVLERALDGELKAQGGLSLRDTHSGGFFPHCHFLICAVTQEGRLTVTEVLF